MSRALAQENGGLANIAGFVIGQLIMSALALVGVWVAGLRFLWRSGRPLWRALVWAYAILFVFFAVTTGGKIYYLAGAYIFLLAAGAVAIDGWLAARAGRLRRLLLATAVSVAIAVPSCCRCCRLATWAGPRRSTRSWPSRWAGRSWSARFARRGPRCPQASGPAR